MKKIVTVFLILSALTSFAADKIDINNAPSDALDSLMIPDDVIAAIKDYKAHHGQIKSIYELRELEGMDSELFSVLKERIAVYPDTTIDSTSVYIMRLQERLASEDSPTEGALDLWQDMLINKMNINKADFNDLMQIDGVGITEAAAIIDNRNKQRRFRYENDVRRSPGLTYFAWSRMRNYIGFEDSEKPVDFSGYYRMKLRYTNDDTYNYTSYSALRSELIAKYEDLKIPHPDSSNLRTSLLLAGMTDEEVDSLRSRVYRESEDLAGMDMNGDIVNKLHLRFGKYASAGFLGVKYSGIEQMRYKGYVNIKNLPYIDNIVLGNYRMVFAEGLVMDNTDEYRSRGYEKTQGLFGDVTESYNTAFTGGALSGNAAIFNYTAMASISKRDAIMNSDGTVNLPLLSRTEITDFRNRYEEKIFGGKLGIELGRLSFLPSATEIGVTGFRSLYDRNFRKDTLTVDIPFDNSTINIPAYNEGFQGDTRTVAGVYFRTSYKNAFLAGEAAMQDSSYAYIAKAGVIFDNFYLRALYRHYEAGFDNLYSRPFSEQGRYDDTEFEKTYRLIDPLFTIVTDDPRPKSEEGLYVETRYRMTEKLTITNAYLDVWKTLDFNMYNYRFQGEVEVRPVFPIRIRLKQKYQQKYLHKDIVPTKSFTNETTMRIFATLTNNDYLNFEARYGKVDLTTSISYIENNFIDGTFVDCSFEHRMNDFMSVVGGYAVWKTDGMSQWIFEDTGIDFLYGNGDKFYIAYIDRLSEYLSLRAKVALKNQDFDFRGISSLDDQYRYYDTDLMRITDFTEYNNLINLSVQVDVRW